ncbi:hypothetical protein IC229_16175 [Spirosoma sp. BT702]|uniref:Adhesin domain-containing protein n=1 Tax=Spirosoma profusum TaxID=2771354 RepID=A0A926XXX3_9BACT|nr:hypothetical protein [Spirosoma profusum]MBD2702190.1 hypothetical protein [Spirosoma profusum]
MKKLLFLLLTATLALPSLAQRIIQKTMPVGKDQIVNLNLRFADSIQVRYWDKPDLSVRISVTINGGKLDDALVVTTGSTDGEVSLKTDYDKELIKKGKPEDCPDQKYSSWSNNRDGTHTVVCSDINYVVFLPRQAQLKLETINGNIDIQGASAPVMAKSISGFVDMSWPKSKGANVEMKTITGEVYSNLDIAFKGKKERHSHVGYLLEGTVNGGGTTVRLESISNDVFLREQK